MNDVTQADTFAVRRRAGVVSDVSQSGALNGQGLFVQRDSILWDQSSTVELPLDVSHGRVGVRGAAQTDVHALL